MDARSCPRLATTSLASSRESGTPTIGTMTTVTGCRVTDGSTFAAAITDLLSHTGCLGKAGHPRAQFTCPRSKVLRLAALCGHPVQSRQKSRNLFGAKAVYTAVLVIDRCSNHP